MRDVLIHIGQGVYLNPHHVVSVSRNGNQWMIIAVDDLRYSRTTDELKDFLPYAMRKGEVWT